MRLLSLKGQMRERGGLGGGKRRGEKSPSCFIAGLIAAAAAAAAVSFVRRRRDRSRNDAA